MSGDSGTITYSGTNRSSVGARFGEDNWTTPGKFLNGEISELIVLTSTSSIEVHSPSRATSPTSGDY
jgi:hypothetical protein